MPPRYTHRTRKRPACGMINKNFKLNIYLLNLNNHKRDACGCEKPNDQ
jgi:hypothetical protein